jgi:hypothetical protein
MDAASPEMLPRLEIASAPWHPERPDGGPVRQRWLDVEGAVVATGGADADGWWMHWPRLATYVFGAAGDVLAHVAAGADPAAVTDSYARGVLPVVLLAREHEALHASGVLQDGHVTAFCAASGTGKSSLALAVAAGGGHHWADDTVVLPPPNGEFEALSLPFPVRVDEGFRARLPGAAARVRVVPPQTRAPLRRIYLLVRDARVDPRSPVFSDVPGAKAFEQLLAHAHPFDLTTTDRRRRMIERLMKAAASVKVGEVRFGPSLEELPTLAARVRERLTGG